MEGHVTNPEPPPIPERIKRLPELALDLWWTWNAQAREVFRRLDYPLWRQTAHNPVLVLKLVSPDLLEKAAADPTFLEQVRQRDRGTRRGAERPRNLVAA